MLVYITQGEKTALFRDTLRGLPVYHLTVGRGALNTWRAARYGKTLRRGGVYRGIFADDRAAMLAEKWGIAPVDVLGLRLAMADALVTAMAGGGLHDGTVYLRCGQGGEETARRCAAVLARRFRYVRPDRDDPAGLRRLLLRRWGVAAGGGQIPLLTVCTGTVKEETAAETLYLTADCALRQQVGYTVGDPPEPVTESVLAALWETGLADKSEIRVVSVSSSLDRRQENHYNTA